MKCIVGLIVMLVVGVPVGSFLLVGAVTVSDPRASLIAILLAILVAILAGSVAEERNLKQMRMKNVRRST